MPLVWNGGPGGGGGGTVQTDGVTIQGDGSGADKIALKAVQHDATLSGNGTVASPLAALPDSSGGFQTGASQFAAIPIQQDAITLMGIAMPRVTFSHIGVLVQNPDATNPCDLGLYSSAGVLLANIGAQTIAGSGAQSFAILQGTISIPGGNYFFAATSSATNLQISGCSDAPTLYFNFAFGTSAGGALPATIVAPALAFAHSSVVFGLF